MDYLNISDFLIALAELILILIFAKIYQVKKSAENPIYRFYYKGLIVKILVALVFLFTYIFYYKGGDTLNYYKSSLALLNLFTVDLDAAVSIFFGNLSKENYSSFNYQTGWPSYYMWLKPKTFSTARITTLFTLLGFKSIISTTILVACFSFYGVWKLFLVFTSIFPKYSKAINLIVFYVPSFIFWGSAIMKDTFVVTAICIVVYVYHNYFDLKKKKLKYLFVALGCFYLIAIIKPYLILSLIPSLGVWYYRTKMLNIASRFARITFFPIIILLAFVISTLSFVGVKDSLGVYGEGVGAIIAKAKLTQEDLLREEQYGANNYDIGHIDGVASIIRMSPIAVFTTLYRPLLNEVASPTMLISALENIVLLFVTIRILFYYKINLRALYKQINNYPILYFSLIFTLILSVGAGIASSNFGALVRYKIPLIPFFYLILICLYKSKKVKK